MVLDYYGWERETNGLTNSLEAYVIQKRSFPNADYCQDIANHISEEVKDIGKFVRTLEDKFLEGEAPIFEVNGMPPGHDENYILQLWWIPQRDLGLVLTWEACNSYSKKMKVRSRRLS